MAIKRPAKIVVIGSSTAAGYGANPADSSWVKLLSDSLRRHLKSSSVINLSKPGYTTYHFLPLSRGTVADRPSVDTQRNITAAVNFKPSLIIINLPTNDIANGYSDSEILNNYSKIVAEIEKRRIAYIITGTQPRSLKTDARVRLKEFNNLLDNMYKNKFVNYFPLLANPELYLTDLYAFGDGVHLNNKGHQLIFKVLFESTPFKSWLDMQKSY